MRYLFFVLALLTLFAPSVLAAAPPATVTVRGKAQLEVPADQARFSLAVVTTAQSADQALQQNASELKAMQKALVAAGLEEGEYRTGHFTVRPQWSPRPQKAAPDWRPAIVGYTVTNSLEIKTGKLAQTGRFIEVATQAGADSVESLVFDLAEPAGERARAIAAAAGQARSEAQALAKAAGVRLGPVQSLQLEPARSTSPRMMRMAAETSTPPLTPGEVTVEAEVTAVYSIAQ